jgi:hypothetical protein
MTESSPLLLTEFNSRKFRFWSFVSMFLLVYVHGYNLHQSFLQPWTQPGEAMTITAFSEYLFANGLLRFRIPMLFLISGYLFAIHDNLSYGQRTRRRLKTLLLPYLLWATIGFAFTWLLECFSFTNDVVARSGIVGIDAHRLLLHDYHWWELPIRWILIPVPYQLWFIRVLLIYNIAYPALRWCILHRTIRWVFFSVAVLMWLGTMNFLLFEGEGLLFFSLGVMIQKIRFNLDVPLKWMHPAFWGITFISLAMVKTFLAFKGYSFLGNFLPWVLIVLHKLVVLSGLIAAWFGCDRIVRFFAFRKGFIWISAFAFMIYAVHAPLVAYANTAVLPLLHDLPLHRMLTYLCLPLAVIGIAVGIGAVLRKLWPAFYGLLTGGRGL